MHGLNLSVMGREYSEFIVYQVMKSVISINLLHNLYIFSKIAHFCLFHKIYFPKEGESLGMRLLLNHILPLLENLVVPKTVLLL